MCENDVFKLSQNSRLALYRKIVLESFRSRIVASGFNIAILYPLTDRLYYKNLKENGFLIECLDGYFINFEKLRNYIDIDHLSSLRVNCYYEKEIFPLVNDCDRGNIIICDFNYPSTPEAMFGLDILADSGLGMVNLDRLAETLQVSSDVLNTAKEEFYGLTRATDDTYYVNVPALCRQLYDFRKIYSCDLDTPLLSKDTTDLFSDLSDE